MEILVLHPGALGDIILAIPAMRRLRRMNPGARMTLAGNLDFLSIVDETCCDRKISLSALPLHSLFCDEPVPAADRPVWESYRRIISWTGSGDRAFERNLRSLCPDAIAASWKPAIGEKKHISTVFAETLEVSEPAGGVIEPASILLDAEGAGDGMAWIRDQGIPAGTLIAAIHPGAGSRAKCWPADRFAALAANLCTRHGVQPIIVEGPAEIGLGAELQTKNSAYPVMASLPLTELAAVLVHCDIFIGNDSGISHLAAGLGLPSVLLFGPTDPDVWAPMGKNVKVLRDCVGCAGCEGSAPAHTCLANVSVESVLEAALTMIRV